MSATLTFPMLLRFPRGGARQELARVAGMFGGAFTKPFKSAFATGDAAVEFAPSDIAGLVRWGNAPSLALANDTPVASYTDVSGAGIHLLQSSDLLKPLYKTNIQNARAAILFDGSNDYLVSVGNVGIAGAAARTVFWVGTTTQNVALCSVGWGAESNTNLFSLGRFNGWYVTGYNLDNVFTAANNNWHVHVVVYNGTILEWFVDGASIGTAARTYATTDSPLNMGKNLAGGNYLAGYIGEDGIYNAAISSASRVALTSYLGTRWNIAVV